MQVKIACSGLCIKYYLLGVDDVQTIVVQNLSGQVNLVSVTLE